MFRTVTIISLIGIVAAAALHFLLVGRKVSAPKGGTPVRRYNVWERLVHLALTVSFLGLAITGFAAVLGGERMEGYSLMIHATLAPVFACALAAMMLTWAGDNKFQKHDKEWFRAGGCCFCCCRGADTPAGRFSGSQKVMFWLSGLLGLATTVTMVASMYPIFSVGGLEVLYRLHRCAGLVFVIVMIMHAYATLLVRRGSWRSLISGNVSSEWAKRFHPLW